MAHSSITFNRDNTLSHSETQNAMWGAWESLGITNPPRLENRDIAGYPEDYYGFPIRVARHEYSRGNPEGIITMTRLSPLPPDPLEFFARNEHLKVT